MLERTAQQLAISLREVRNDIAVGERECAALRLSRVLKTGISRVYLYTFEER